MAFMPRCVKSAKQFKSKILSYCIYGDLTILYSSNVIQWEEKNLHHKSSLRRRKESGTKMKCEETQT
jgi:hypothetical protein